MATDSPKGKTASDQSLVPNKKVRREDALAYHSTGRKGKIEVIPTKPCATARDLALAYSPGVAEPCLEIAKDQDLSYTYTARGNLVGVVSNGTAVLGLGDIGCHAGKPVMEGKGVLFKKFADVDVFDIEVDATDIDHFCTVVKALEPTFGGINLEDIKAPECFVIEERLKREMQIPVMHDDQHGTAIISGAALLNAVEVAGKSLDKVRVVVSGAGASALACTRFYIALGVKKENVLLVDTKGVVYKGRTEGMNQWKAEFAAETRCRTLADAMEGADVFLGCSAKGLVTQRMVQTMAKDPIVFALANPDPEISYPEAKEARQDVIMATGRSDYPNQVNNVLGFPFIFRGALDVRAKAINEAMKMAAARAIAALAREEVPESVSRAYSGESFSFGREYIIPKPLDPRVLLWVAPAVAQAAMESGVARQKIDLAEYRERLRKTQSRTHAVMSTVYQKAKKKLARIVFVEGHHPKIQHAAQILQEDGICEPILLGPVDKVRGSIEENRLDGLRDVKIVNPLESDLFAGYVSKLWDTRGRKGMTFEEAKQRVRQRAYFGALMVKEGQADGLVTGLTTGYADAIRAPLQVIGTRAGRRAAGVYIVVTKNEFRFFADCTVNADPNAEELADIAVTTADLARYFDVTPRVAMLSYSTFGSSRGASPDKVREATELVRQRHPELEVDGEIQVDIAMSSETRVPEFPFTNLKEDANVLVFPNLDAANIGYQLLNRIGGAEVIGPVLLGMHKPVNILQMGTSVQSIVNLAAFTALRAQGDQFTF
ncbi:NADP-dependent malic enzyme [Anaeromyxobacter diazotrophicus]|uniref:Bifunctional malic enzyme oxidoreductase/phosphotransacetylase n=1 Tax=Anaeromyxobacter diazotrophicus TaxID=2590199 RepID=A0A7I9VH86_9BACT|nr:NADP-dependent malic enzyme [Anaeromyxobacter diazotrophicus]GEJ55756.1 bifunctional malic enzyme oxidoreductase/phosphotransacetylase [Anaeromyxobacter diazotrophicus]